MHPAPFSMKKNQRVNAFLTREFPSKQANPISQHNTTDVIQMPYSTRIVKGVWSDTITVNNEK